MRLDWRHWIQLPIQTPDASFEVVDGKLEVDGLLETNGGAGLKTLVVPVATGVRLGVDTVCLLWGASPWERRPVTCRSAKERAQAPGSELPGYQGSFALIGHLRRRRVAPVRCKGS